MRHRNGGEENSGKIPWAELRNALHEFNEERDWTQFHNPKDLAAALAIEAAELQETMLWRSDADIRAVLDSNPDLIVSELADVFIYALLLAHVVGCDVEEIVRSKIASNAKKYPSG